MKLGGIGPGFASEMSLQKKCKAQMRKGEGSSISVKKNERSTQSKFDVMVSEQRQEDQVERNSDRQILKAKPIASECAERVSAHTIERFNQFLNEDDYDQQQKTTTYGQTARLAESMHNESQNPSQHRIRTQILHNMNPKVVTTEKGQPLNQEIKIQYYSRPAL